MNEIVRLAGRGKSLTLRRHSHPRAVDDHLSSETNVSLSRLGVHGDVIVGESFDSRRSRDDAMVESQSLHWLRRHWVEISLCIPRLHRSGRFIDQFLVDSDDRRRTVSLGDQAVSHSNEFQSSASMDHCSQRLSRGIDCPVRLGGGRLYGRRLSSFLFENLSDHRIDPDLLYLRSPFDLDLDVVDHYRPETEKSHSNARLETHSYQCDVDHSFLRLHHLHDALSSLLVLAVLHGDPQRRVESQTEHPQHWLSLCRLDDSELELHLELLSLLDDIERLSQRSVHHCSM